MSITERSVWRKARRAPGSFEWLHGARDRAQVHALPGATSLQSLTGVPEHRQDEPVCSQREQRGGSGQCRAAQQGAHLAAQPAARHEHEALGALGELVEELHRDAATQRVAHDCRPVDSDRCEQVANAGRMRAERVVTAGRGGVTMSDQVGSDHGVGISEPKRHRLPMARRVHHPVDQDHGRAAAGDPVDHPVAVQLDLPCAELAPR